jgi:hypothetical protein
MGNHLVSVLFTDTKDGKPGIVIDGHFIGYARRIEFFQNAYSATGSVLVASRIEVDPEKNISGIPLKRFIPESLRAIVELTKKEEETDG